MKQRGFPVVVGFAKPSQDFILVSGVRVQPCNTDGRNVGALGAECQCLRSKAHGSSIATLRIAARQCVRHFMIVQDYKEFDGFRQGFDIHPLLVVGAPKAHVRRRKVRFRGENLA